MGCVVLASSRVSLGVCAVSLLLAMRRTARCAARLAPSPSPLTPRTLKASRVFSFTSLLTRLASTDHACGRHASPSASPRRRVPRRRGAAAAHSILRIRPSSNRRGASAAAPDPLGAARVRARRT
eukprot:1750689-Rhodomonas_salina.1